MVAATEKRLEAAIEAAPRGAVGESAVEGAAGHERVVEAGLLPAALPRQAEAQERHEVLVPVLAQHHHLPKRLPQALLRALRDRQKTCLTALS